MKSELVRTRDKIYALHIGPNRLQQLPVLIQHLQPIDGLYLLTDKTVSSLYADTVLELIQKKVGPVHLLCVPPGEKAKSFAVLLRLYTDLLKTGANRDSVILALGGGVVGDLAGFVAATFMRGIRWAQVATTLIAQTDSSIGGKVGLNHPLGKNLIGAFHHPEWVLIDPQLLRTLPAREIRAGLAEVIKYALIKESRLFATLENRLDDLVNLADMELLTKVIRTSCIIKARIVKADERERGQRIILNFGHTLGHALEAASGYHKYRHGEAVTLGMIAAVEISSMMGFLKPDIAEKIYRLLRRLDPPRMPGKITSETILSHLTFDKKRGHQGQKWVLLKGIGSVLISASVKEEVIVEALASVKQRW